MAALNIAPPPLPGGPPVVNPGGRPDPPPGLKKIGPTPPLTLTLTTPEMAGHFWQICPFLPIWGHLRPSWGWIRLTKSFYLGQRRSLLVLLHFVIFFENIFFSPRDK